MTSHCNQLGRFTIGLLSVAAFVSVADAAGRPEHQRPLAMERSVARAVKPQPILSSMPRRYEAQPHRIAVQKVSRDIERTTSSQPRKFVTMTHAPLSRPVPLAPTQVTKHVLTTATQPDPRVTTPPLAVKRDPRVTTPALGTLRPTVLPQPGRPVAGLPPLPPGPVIVAPKGQGFEPGPRADGGNSNNNAGAGQHTGGNVGRGGVAVDSSDQNVSVGKDGTFVIGGASANGGDNNANATGHGARTGNNSGRGGKVVDDRDYNIDPSQGSKIVVKADTANGGNNNGNDSQGGHAGRGNGNGGKVVDDRDIVIKGGDKGNTIVIEKDQATSGVNNGHGNGEAGRVIDRRDIKIEVDAGDKIIYGGKEIRADAGDVVTIHNGQVHVDRN